MDSLLDLGYLGLFIGSFISATVIPMGADALLLGMLAAGGKPVWCLAIATTGNWLGGTLTYWLGYAGKWTWIQRWFKVTPEKLKRQKNRIEKYKSVIALLVWVPVLGDLFALALGFYRINAVKSFIFMFFGRLIRFLFWLVLYLLWTDKFVKFISHL